MASHHKLFRGQDDAPQAPGVNMLKKYIRRDTNGQELSPDIVHLSYSRSLGPKTNFPGPAPFELTDKGDASSMTASVQYKFGGVVASAEDAYAVASKYKTPTVSGRPSIGSIMAQRVPPGSSTIPVVPSPASRDFEGLTKPYHYHPTVERTVGQITMLNLVPGTRFGEHICSMTGHSYAVTDIAINYDGKRCVSGSSDGSVRQWDLQRGCGISQGTGHRGLVRVALGRDETEIDRSCLSGDERGNLKLWDIGRSEARMSWNVHSVATPEIISVAMTAKYALAAAGSEVFVYDFRKISEPLKVQPHAGKVRSIAVTAEGSSLFKSAHGDRCMSCADDSIKMWTIGACDEPSEGPSIPNTNSAYSAAVTTDGTTTVCATRSTRRDMQVWDLSQFPARQQMSFDSTMCGDSDALATRCIAIANDGLHALSTSVGCRVHYWHLAHGTCESLVGVSSGKCRRIALSLDGYVGLCT